MIRNTDLTRQWASLGISFAGSLSENADPERAILDLVFSDEFPLDKKMMSLAVAWLKEYSGFVHVERLLSLAGEVQGLPAALLGGLASKCVGFGDRRWRSIESAMLEATKKWPGEVRDPDSLLSLKGIDGDFLKFRVQVIPVLGADPKKLMRRSHVVSKNLWIKNRLLFGTNFRADMATILDLQAAETAYGAAKILGCSMTASYRLWRDLHEAGWGCSPSRGSLVQDPKNPRS